jgi:biotin synthase
MIGLPFQTCRNLAEDALFFKQIDADMIGMGPFIFHKDTPLYKYYEDFYQPEEKLLELGLKMIAVTRLLLRDVNIAATTALQALKHNGRELGLQAGANVIMPNATDTKYREGYKLYENKPCTDENASMCRNCLNNRITGIGETVGFGGWGDSPHFKARIGKS